MPRYSYTAKSLTNDPRTGTAEAKNEHELARTLRRESFILIKADLETGEKKKKKFSISLNVPAIWGVSLVDKMMFVRNLRVMITAGISIPRALQLLSSQAKSKKLKAALLGVSEEVIRGKSFSDSLAKYPDIFSELFQNMIKIGEEAGTLEDVLKVLAQQMEREHELSSKIKGALMYPAVIILAMLGIGFLMLTMVIPKLAETFKELAIDLPITTRIVIALGNFSARYWYLIPLLIFAFVFLFWQALKTKRGKMLIDNFVLKIPVVSNLIKKTNSASTARTLSALIASGVPIVRSLEIVSHALSNFYFREAMADVAEKVRKGSKISEALTPYQNIYPSLVVQMLAVGEETGQTSDILQKLADFYEEEVLNVTKNLSSIIEPVLMLIIGAAVGFFAISMIQPMYSMLGAIK